jgi:hypothetical protein
VVAIETKKKTNHSLLAFLLAFLPSRLPFNLSCITNNIILSISCSSSHLHVSDSLLFLQHLLERPGDATTDWQ